MYCKRHRDNDKLKFLYFCKYVFIVTIIEYRFLMELKNKKKKRTLARRGSKYSHKKWSVY